MPVILPKALGEGIDVVVAAGLDVAVRRASPEMADAPVVLPLQGEAGEEGVGEGVVVDDDDARAGVEAHHPDGRGLHTTLSRVCLGGSLRFEALLREACSHDGPAPLPGGKGV